MAKSVAKGCGGCLVVVVILVAGSVALVAWVANSALTGQTASNAPSEVSDSHPAQIVVQDKANVDGILKKIADAKASLDDKRKKLKSVTTAAMDEIQKRPDYVTALADSNKTLAALIEARRSHSDSLPDISQKWINSKGILNQITERYLNIPAIQTDRKAVADAENIIISLQKQETEAEHQEEIAEANNPAGERSPDSSAAYVGYASAKKIITPLLNDPSNAEFDFDNVTATPMDNYTDEFGKIGYQWNVQGIVRSKNSFGAIVPDTWSAMILEADGNLFPREVSIDGIVVYN